MISVTFPDGASRALSPAFQGSTLPNPSRPRSPSAPSPWRWMANSSISPIDPSRCAIEFVSREDPRALELIRHDAAHVLAEAVQTLFPGTQVTIGR